jgi:hypothetical protein
MARYKWIPLIKTTDFKPPAEELIQITMEFYNLSREEAIQAVEKDHENTEIYINDLYQVQVRKVGEPEFYQLNIRRRDGGPILRDWRHFQYIKNQLLGEECEAVELYPAESRLVDTSNKFHLWGTRDPTYRFPFGFDARYVEYVDSKVPGLRQRPL